MPQPAGWPSSIIATVTNCAAAGVTTLTWSDAETRFEGGDFFTSAIADPPPVSFTLDTVSGGFTASYNFNGQTFTLDAPATPGGNYEGGTVTLTNPRRHSRRILDLAAGCRWDSALDSKRAILKGL